MSHYTRIKICGLTSPSTAIAAVEAGADAIGLNFHPGSPRHIDLEVAADIARAVGPFVTVVGLIANAEAAAIRDALATVPLHMLQFHGDESPDFCEQFSRPYLKALRVPTPDDNSPEAIARVQQQVIDTARTYATASGILLDAYSTEAWGGTGKSFNWDCVPSDESGDGEPAFHWVLAGGLNPDNVEEAIARTHPHAVDVSSGVESSRGVKDVEKIQEFIARVRRSYPIERRRTR